MIPKDQLIISYKKVFANVNADKLYINGLSPAAATALAKKFLTELKTKSTKLPESIVQNKKDSEVGRTMVAFKVLFNYF